MQLREETRTARNMAGWQSLASRWDSVGWPRRPKWHGEFSAAAPLLATLREQDVMVLGSTPEFRAWLQLMGARVSVCEANPGSYAAMTQYLLRRGIRVDGEAMIHRNWTDSEHEKGRYAAVLGDMVSGYLMTHEIFGFFLRNVHDMLGSNGFFLLREFVLAPCEYPLERIHNPHLRRWSAVMTDGIAIEGRKYYEEGLIQHLRKTNDQTLLSTCGNPPRERLILTYNEFEDAFIRAGFEPRLLVAPEASPSKPAVWILWKKDG